MPIPQNLLFKCTKCDYMENRIIGDVLPDMNSLKACSSCGALMKRVDGDRLVWLVDVLKSFFKMR